MNGKEGWFRYSMISIACLKCCVVLENTQNDPATILQRGYQYETLKVFNISTVLMIGKRKDFKVYALESF